MKSMLVVTLMMMMVIFCDSESNLDSPVTDRPRETGITIKPD
jgi:hypothetical protein